MEHVIAGLQTRVLAERAPADAPLIVALHGIGADEQDLAPVYEAWETQAVLVFPRGPHDHPPGFAWYELYRPGHPVPASFGSTQRLLEAWLADLRALPGLGQRPVYLSGFSQGAFVALSYALHHPDAIAGVMAFSGLLPRGLPDGLPVPPAAVRHLPVFLTLGLLDPLFPVAWLEESVDQLVAWGVNPTVVPHPGGHEIPPMALAAARAWFAGRTTGR